MLAYSLILILSVWACCNQAAPTSSLSKDDLNLMKEIAAQTSKRVLDSLFENKEVAEAVQQYWTTSEFIRDFAPRKTEKVNQQVMPSTFNGLYRKYVSSYKDAARAQLLNGLRNKLSRALSNTNLNYYRQYPTQAPTISYYYRGGSGTNQYPTQSPYYNRGYYNQPTSSYEKIQELLEMSQEE